MPAMSYSNSLRTIAHSHASRQQSGMQLAGQGQHSFSFSREKVEVTPRIADDQLRLEKQFSSLIHSCMPAYEHPGTEARTSNVSEPKYKESFVTNPDENPFEVVKQPSGSTDQNTWASKDKPSRSSDKMAWASKARSEFHQSAIKQKENQAVIPILNSAKNANKTKFQFPPAVLSTTQKTRASHMKTKSPLNTGSTGKFQLKPTKKAKTVVKKKKSTTS